jgi:hypothetical protein
MRRKFTFLVTLWWMIVCGAVGVCMLLFADPDPVASEEENRTLAGMPQITAASLRNGELGESFERFMTDQFFLRSELIDGVTSLKHIFSALTVDELLSGEGEEVFVPALNPNEGSLETAAEPEAAIEDAPADNASQDIRKTPESAPQTGESASVWLIHRDGSRTALLTYTREELLRAADTLNAYAALLPDGGRMHVLLIPRSQNANKLALHTDEESGWTSEVESALQALVSSNVTVHSAYDILQQPLIEGAYLYFRTDHHWTARGAYLAADAMLKNAGYQTVPLSDYKEKTIEDYLGSIYLHGKNAKLEELKDNLEVFYPLLPAKSYRVSNAYRKNELPVIDETKTNYLVFLGGTYGPYRMLEGGYHTGRNMLMICDSFGNSIAPFFMPYYDNVYMVDFRDEYYTLQDAQGGVKEYVRRLGIDDLYVVLSDTNSIGSAYFNRLLPANID